MPEIPDASSIGLATPRPTQNVPRYPGNPAVVGEAISSAATEIGSAVKQQQDQADEFDYAKARTAYLVGKTDLESEIQDTTKVPWPDAAKTYDQKVTELQKQAAGFISNPKYLARFNNETMLDNASGLAAVKHYQRGKEIDAGKGYIENAENQNLMAALSNPKDAPAIIASQQSLWDGGVAKGYLSDAEAVNRKDVWLQKYYRGYVEGLPADQAIALLGKRLAGRFGGSDSVAPGDIWGAIHNQESGGRATAPTSADGAVGGAQILPQTFAQYAKPGEKITNAQDNIAVGQRIVADYSEKFGGDPARVAVAYFSGPGNVAPPGSPEPWIKDIRDQGGKGKSTSSYVNDVLGRLGAGSASDLPPQKTGTPIDFMPLSEVATMYHGAVSDQRQARIIADQAETVALHGIQDQFIQKLAAGTLTSQEVLNSPLKPFGEGSKNEFLGLLRTNSGAETTLGPGFWDIYKRVIAPPGTPGRITDQSQLYSLAGPGKPLSLSGISELSKIISGKGSPSGEAETAMQRQFFENARHQITGSNEGLHLVDPKGDELFLRFQAHAFADIAAKKAKGMTAAQIYNPESPDYAGKIIPTFKRPMAQWTSDISNDAGTGGFDPSSLKTLPDIQAAVQSRKMTRAAGIALARQRGFLADDPPPVPMGGGGR